uniref:Uncharacterized protein n=1 Tax=Chromera velia CCMP2878 TaxID=1169474 RepID=A0A0G4GNL2_9ALVE|eukprot:Cvel_4972.t1-p1 / transcript=Cvel_4972.t1 / gene=Cvel_4972 / organism=Chromera_velia_CCMP2878 / gene_product=hypothetical protein / transcript_product=hypothetical protein / location=Cvel_scaffold225:9098-9814(-) / protein_length=239 / sequence_SO=supercontig / SO=protein_coding / is_pseudo=false
MSETAQHKTPPPTPDPASNQDGTDNMERMEGRSAVGHIGHTNMGGDGRLWTTQGGDGGRGGGLGMWRSRDPQALKRKTTSKAGPKEASGEEGEGVGKGRKRKIEEGELQGGRRERKSQPLIEHKEALGTRMQVEEETGHKGVLRGVRQQEETGYWHIKNFKGKEFWKRERERLYLGKKEGEVGSERHTGRMIMERGRERASEPKETPERGGNTRGGGEDQGRGGALVEIENEDSESKET